jgi:AraC-like DNA-binding protein
VTRGLGGWAVEPRFLAEFSAGSVEGYSNQAIAALTEVLGHFARPRHPEKSLAELQQLFESIENSSPRPARVVRTRAVSAERKLGKDQVAALLARYAEGISCQVVGQEFGVSGAAVMRLVRKHGQPLHPKLASPELVAEAAELYKSGLSLQRVADQVGITKWTLQREFKKVGVVTRSPQSSPGAHLTRDV